MRPEHREDSVCRLAVQASFSGPQGFKVMAVAAHAARDGKAHLAVRVGSLLVYIEDHAALETLIAAWRQASELGREILPAEPDAFDIAEARARRNFEKGLVHRT